MYIELGKDVAASYYTKTEKRQYSGTSLFTFDELLYCECVCAAGAKQGGSCRVNGLSFKAEHCNTSNYDRHVCVHSLTRLYSLALELHTGLAESILIDLNVRI